MPFKKTKKPLKTKSSRPQSLSQELIEEQNEEQFWDQVEENSKWRVYEILTQNIPLHNVKLIEDNWQVGGVKKVDELNKKVGLLPDKDVDFRVILRDDIPSYLEDDEEFQAKIENGNWTDEDVNYVAQLVTFHYLVAVIKGINNSLQTYDCYDSAYLEGLTE